MAKFGEPYWRRSWQVQGVDACPAHGCTLVDSPIPFRRAQRHEFHAASSLFLHHGATVQPCEEGAIKLAGGLTALGLHGSMSPVMRCGPTSIGIWPPSAGEPLGPANQGLGHMGKGSLSFIRGLACSQRPMGDKNCRFGYNQCSESTARHFSFLQHLIVWTSLRPGQAVHDPSRSNDLHRGKSLPIDLFHNYPLMLAGRENTDLSGLLP